MRIVLYIFLVLSCSSQLFSQVISEFNWNNGSVTNAETGPAAISVSSSCTVDFGGTNGTTGLNAGLPKKDIDMVLPANAFLDVTGIDFSIDFQRDESRGDFITCGTSFSFGVDGGDLYVIFEIDDTNGGTTLVQENNIYSVPDDDIMRTYRFYYLPYSGDAQISVNNDVVWDSTFASPAPLILPNEDVIIGKLMDGNGLDKTIFDNLVIGEVHDSALPIELASFDVQSVHDGVLVEWITETEQNNDFFTVERSQDGQHFNKLVNIDGAGSSTTPLSYKFIDDQSKFGLYYYRLRQTDFNGNSSVSAMVSVKISASSSFRIFPNSINTNGEFQLELPATMTTKQVNILSIDGTPVVNYSPSLTENSLTLKGPGNSGIYLVQVITNNEILSKKLVVR